MHASKQLYALSRSRTESSVDAGIPQAEACGTGGCARVACRKSESAAHAPEDRVLSKGCGEHPYSVGTGAVFSHRDARVPGMPVLL